MAAVNDGGGDGGCHRWRQWSLSMEAMLVFVTDGNDKGQQWQGRTRAWGCGRPCGATLSSSGAKWQLLEQQQQVEMLKLAFCRLANTRVLAERQNASFNKSVSRVRIPTPVDHVTTARLKTCANAKYLIAC